MKRWRYRCLAAALTLAATAALARSQRPDAPATLRVDVKLVNIYATVIDSTGRCVGGLTSKDFLVGEDGKRQTIAHFSHDENTPVSIGVVFDMSGSMRSKLDTASGAVERFFRTLHGDDDIVLMGFANEPFILQDFTSDRSKLTRALDQLDANGSTALYDALDAGIDKIRFGLHNKRAILLITDGQDTNSATTFGEIRQAIRESELLVYSLGISPTSNPQPLSRASVPGRFGGADTVDMDVLKIFAADSGGRAYLVTENMLGGRNSRFDQVLAQIAEELRSQYNLGYYPDHPDDGQYHSIEVRTRNGYHVRARQGYVAK
jgi:Ca-activated chloride channel homolog